MVRRGIRGFGFANYFPDGVTLHMKNTIGGLALVTAAAACACFGQTVQPGRLSFNGVGLGSAHRAVVKAIGKPLKETPPKPGECAGGREKMNLFYGASFRFMDGDSTDRKTFRGGKVA